MLVSRRVLPLCVLFVCAAGEAPRGICKDKRCFALFLQSLRFTEAGSRCRGTGGELSDTFQWNTVPALLLPPGHFWINATLEPGAQPEEQCWSTAAEKDDYSLQNRTCTDRLDGFICQYSYTSTCRALQPRGRLHVNYTLWGFEVKAVFPAGTVAMVLVPGGPPDSRHVCTGVQWQRAPWSCEVMKGGCEHACNPVTDVCSCPAGQILHHNNFMCTEDPCAKCAPDCVLESGECSCKEGHRLGAGGRCVDIDECSEDSTLCSSLGQVCENQLGSYQCTCQEDYEWVGEACVDMSICFNCEQDCQEVQGSMTCACHKGFRVHPKDPTKCEDYCSEQDCPARCMSKDQCYCPKGYIQDHQDNGTVCTDIDECELENLCEQLCLNTYGGFICQCDEGYLLQDEYLCESIEPPVLEQVYPTATWTHPTAIPFYVKTGSILGITVFVVLCVALLYFLLNCVVRYCTKVQFYSLKHDMDIFTLQQVSTETYKRLSYDWQNRNDCHRL